MNQRLLLLLGLWLTQNVAVAQLTDYQVFFGKTKPPSRSITLRRWLQNGQPTYLTLDPETLKTAINALPDGTVRPTPFPALLASLRQTPYGRAMLAEVQRDAALQDAGLNRADTTERGFSLTIDLCPSTKPLTRSVFRQMIRAFESVEKPIPVTITVTGLWMISHANDLAFLKKLHNRGDLAITWVNHSYHHRYDPARALTNNFLLETGTNLTDEVLGNEQAMIGRGLLPSVLFRFPGLVSDKAVFDQVLAFGLLPIGSDAWLAKGQAPRRGSLVLIHANGNEPLGIRDFLALIRQHSADIQHKTWLLYDLPTSLSVAGQR